MTVACNKKKADETKRKNYRTTTSSSSNKRQEPKSKSHPRGTRDLIQTRTNKDKRRKGGEKGEEGGGTREKQEHRN